MIAHKPFVCLFVSLLLVRLSSQDSEGSFQLYIDKGRLGDEFKVRYVEALLGFVRELQ